ncbi:MAG: hypothetical protein HYR62_01835 [Actinobacteria bacterium]|nr:hypothetical protein [Actinomycetota bacterium]MBI3687223.1 hypothetical protein [Actinomycetota bacterium]
MTQNSYEAGTGALHVEEITVEEAWRRLDAEARLVLNISGEEFRTRWMAGEFREHDDPKVAQLAILLPDAW